MSFEIDYIPVGDGAKSGNAIALRFGNLAGPRKEQTVVVIDGGFKESGEELVKHIKSYYNTDSVDLAMLTHPDADHASGLSVVLENMQVGQLVMHKPWDHAEDIKNLFKNGRITSSGLEERIEKSLQNASDLEALAKKKNVPIVEPFQGVGGYNGAIHILGPSQEYYSSLLPLFRSTPEPAKSVGVLTPMRKAIEEAINWIQDHVGIDLLNDDEDSTSAENNSSAIVLFSLDGHKLLFTGDAGKTALLNAIGYANSQEISLVDLRFFDVPHHGSKRNLSSKILRSIKTNTAFVSAPTNSSKHPAKKITNALKKNGASVYVTKGAILWHHQESPLRPGWGPAQEEPFYDQVEK